MTCVHGAKGSRNMAVFVTGAS